MKNWAVLYCMFGTVATFILQINSFPAPSSKFGVKDIFTLLQEINDDFHRCASAPYHSEWNDVVSLRYQAANEAIKEKCLSPDALSRNGFSEFGPSGMGSSVYATSPLRSLLHSLFSNETYQIRSFFDAPCGDWVWMQLVNLSGIQYLGGDITRSTIETNSYCHAAENIHFTLFDLVCQVPPPADLVLVRDLLFHLKDNYIMKILDNINKSGAKYLLSTTFLGPNEKKRFYFGGYLELQRERGSNSSIGYRELNLMDRPFCLPEPLLLIRENTREDRYLGLWSVPFSLGCSELGDVDASVDGAAGYEVLPNEPCFQFPQHCAAFPSRIIWMYWEQGEADLRQNNPYQLMCVIAWKILNPEWKFILLDRKSSIQYVPAIEHYEALTVQRRSDILRLMLLIRYGGVWADTTVLPVKPLDMYIKVYAGAPQHLFMYKFFTKPSEHHLTSNWFIAAPCPNHPSLSIWLLRVITNLYEKHLESNYFATHAALGQLYTEGNGLIVCTVDGLIVDTKRPHTFVAFPPLTCESVHLHEAMYKRGKYNPSIGPAPDGNIELFFEKYIEYIRSCFDTEWFIDASMVVFEEAFFTETFNIYQQSIENDEWKVRKALYKAYKNDTGNDRLDRFVNSLCDYYYSGEVSCTNKLKSALLMKVGKGGS